MTTPALSHRLGHLPAGAGLTPAWRAVPDRPDGPWRLPVLDGPQWAALLAHLRGPARARLRQLPVREIMQAIDRTALALLEPGNPGLAGLLAELPAWTGQSPEMVRVNLQATLRLYRQSALQRLLAEELGGADVLDGFAARAHGGLSHAEGVPLIGHVWAGNVPGLPLWGLVSGLLVKSAQIGKVSLGEPLVASVFAQTLAQVHPVLGDALAVLWWDRDDPVAPHTVWPACDVVQAFGGDAALASLQQQMPAGVRFVPHGHKISFGAIGREALGPNRIQRVARLAAEDVVRHEQQGCYSPQCWFVEEGGAAPAQEFAERLAAALAQLATRYPRPAPDLASAHRIAQWRSQLQWRDGVQVIGQAEDPWAVAFHAQPTALTPGPLHRCVQVVALPDLSALAAQLTAWPRHLQSVGLALAPERLQPLALALAACGVTRLSAVGQMPLPAPGWHNDGRPNLIDLVQWVDLEASAEQLAEGLSRYEV